jgi:magnesium transporter
MLEEMKKLTGALTSLYSSESQHIGAAPGEVKIKEDTFPPLEMSVVNYNSSSFTLNSIENIGEVTELSRKEIVSWLIVNGFGDSSFLEKLKIDLGLHGLVIEEMVTLSQPPKIEFLEDSLFVLLRFAVEAGGRIDAPLSIIVSESNLYLFSPTCSFQSGERLVKRIKNEKGAIRKKGVDYLLFALIDLVVDSYFPKIDVIAQSIKEIDEGVFEGRSNHLLHEIKTIRQVLNVYFDNLQPIKDIIDKILSDENELVKPENIRYFNHASNHVSYLCERISRLKESTSDIMNLNLALNGQKMNEIMKMLTIMSSIFIPLSFLCGLYGMNFDTSKSVYNMPELSYAYGYPILIGVMLSVVLGMLFYFRKKKWI